MSEIEEDFKVRSEQDHDSISGDVMLSEGFGKQIDLADFSPHGLLLLSSGFEFLQANRAFFELTHQCIEDVQGRGWLHCLPHLQAQSVANKLTNADWQTSANLEIECQLITPTGKQKWIKIIARAIGIDCKSPNLYALTIEDIDNSKRAADKNMRLARIDSLTGLPNRRDFEDTLTNCLQQASAARSIMAVLFIDLDGFKQVNDNFGHEKGDKLLKDIAKCIESFSARATKVARLGGDEFTVLLTDLKRIEEVKHYASNLVLLLQKSISNNEVEANVSASIGIAIHHKMIEDRRGVDRIVTDLLRHADHAMYAAKEAGKNCYRFYGENEQCSYGRGSLQNQDSLIRSLHHALENNEMYVLYQPQIDTKSSQISGCEVLLRWEHHLHGLIGPLEFIPAAETGGALDKLTTWLIERVCADFNSTFLPDAAFAVSSITDGTAVQGSVGDRSKEFTVSINLSQGQLQNSRTLRKIDRIFVKHSVPCERIKFEVTEQALIADPRLAADSLNFLKERGYRISLDDFGTGYSSLSHLHRFPIDEIKLDGRFISDVGQSDASRTIVKGVVNLVHSLGMNVVAEGVETQAQLDFLSEVGCEQWQGFLRSGGVHARELLSSRSVPGPKLKVINSGKRQCSKSLDVA